MANAYEAYGVYWVPGPRDPLGEFGCRWTGWCAEEGRRMPPSDWAGFPDGPGAITAELGRHGLHGALWGPCALGEEKSTFTLEHLVEAAAGMSPVIRLPAFEVDIMDGRVALVPVTEARALNRLVALLAQSLDPLRAVPSSDVAEGAPERHFPAAENGGLHVPLTDPLAEAEARALLPPIADLVTPFLDRVRYLSELCLMGDPGGGRPLRIIERFRLAGADASDEDSALPFRGADQRSHRGGGTAH